MNGEKVTLLYKPSTDNRKTEKLQLLMKYGVQLVGEDQLNQQKDFNFNGVLMSQESDEELLAVISSCQYEYPLLVLLEGDFSRGFADRLQVRYAAKVEVVRLLLLADGERAVLGGDVVGKWVTYLRRTLAKHEVISLICRRIEADEVAVHLPIFLLWKKRFYEQLGESCDHSSASLPVVAQALGLDKRVGQWWMPATSGDTDPYLLTWLTKQYESLLKKTNIDTIAIWGGLSSKNRIPFIDKGKMELRIYGTQKWEIPNELHSTSTFCRLPEEALIGADLLIIMEADQLVQQFRLDTLKNRMRQPIVLDACFCFPLQEAEGHGIIYRTYGQKTNVWEWN